MKDPRKLRAVSRKSRRKPSDKIDPRKGFNYRSVYFVSSRLTAAANPEHNNEVKQVLEKNDEKRFLVLVYLGSQDEQLAYEIKKKTNIYAWF